MSPAIQRVSNDYIKFILCLSRKLNGSCDCHEDSLISWIGVFDTGSEASEKADNHLVKPQAKFCYAQSIRSGDFLGYLSVDVFHICLNEAQVRLLTADHFFFKR